MKKLLWIVLIAIIALFGWRLYKHFVQPQEASGKQGKSGLPTPVEISPVQVIDMQDVGRFGGSLQPRSGYSLAPRVSGRLDRLLVHLGDKVSNGQLVAILDDSVYQQALEQARAELAVVNAQVEQARLALKASAGSWETAKSLFSKNYTSQALMDQADAEHAAAQAKYDIAQAEVLRAKAVVKTAEIQLSYTQIKAVWNGGGAYRMVGERFADEGAMLTTSTPLMTLVDNSVVTAEIDIIERDYARIKLGQAVQIATDAYPQRTFSGTLARLAPVLQEASRQARAEIDIPNPEGLLKPGMFVRVQIVYAQHPGVTVVPLPALLERDGKTGVLVADKTTLTAKFVPLTLGIKDEANAEVLSPVLMGDVIILGQEQLQDGGKIKLPQPKSETVKGKRGGKQ